MKKVEELGTAIFWLVSRFVAERRGAILIYVAILLPVLIGGALLAVDASKFFNLQTLLQKGADALAVAGAAELDGKPTAITRANAAIANLVQNQHRFSDVGATQIAVSNVRFLSGLPANDATAIDASYDTIDPLQARYVEVTVATQNMTSVFPASFLGGSNTVTAGAQAVAGLKVAVCQFTPMFMCNPFENTEISLFDAMKDPNIRRRQIVLRKGGGGTSQYSAGNYGFLQPPTGEMGANVIREMLGATHPPACFVQEGVELRPGFIASADQGLNVRFDMYDGAFNSMKGNSNFRPAKNVRKGYGGNGCAAAPDAENPGLAGLPDDSCFATDSCPHMGGRMGDGDWDIDGYKAANNLAAIPYSNANPGSRYEVYRYEIDNNLVNTPSAGGEVGTPQCFTDPSSLSDDPDRRFLFIAALDCQTHNVSEENMGNSGPPVPVVAFVKMFLTRPVDQGPDQEIYAEMTDIIEPGNTATPEVRDIVQLYR